MEKPYLNNNIKLDEQALKDAFIYNLNKIYPILIHLTSQLPNLANESCYGDLDNAIVELSTEINLHIKRFNIIFDQLEVFPTSIPCLITTNNINVLVPDTQDYLLDNLSKDLYLIFYIQKVLNFTRSYYTILRSIAGSLNNIDIKQYLQYSYDECRSNQDMFRLIAKEYMDTSINTFLR